MLNERSRVELLLSTLASFGRADEAEMFRIKFERAAWKLTDSDLVELQTALMHGLVSGPVAPLSEDDLPRTTQERSLKASAPVPPSSELPDWLEPLFQYAPYLCTLDEAGHTASLSLLERVNALLGATNFEEFRSAVLELMIRELRYEELTPIDELPRFATNHSFGAIWRIARYDEDLPVFVVEDLYAGPHPNVYYPIFQLSRRCIIFAYCTRIRRSRIVFRGYQTVAHYRTLVGRAQERESGENLLTLTRRFASLRPDGIICGRDLELRLRRAFAEDVNALIDKWPIPEFERGPTGAAWHNLLKYELETFLSQRSAPGGRRLHVGLEALFRNRFPLPVCRGAHRLDLIRWELIEGSRSIDRWQLICAAATRSVTIRLTFRSLLGPEGEALNYDFVVDAELPVPDENGELVIDGTPAQLCFQLDEAGVSEDEASEDWRELDESDDEELSSHRDLSDKFVDSELAAPCKETGLAAEEDADEQDVPTVTRGNRRSPPTCSLNTLWTFLVERRLARLAQCLWDANRPPTSSQEFLFVTRRIRARNREFPLLALGQLWRHLRHASTLEPVATAVVHRECDLPPAWACVETASRTLDGHWVPISSARLHPVGQLAIPARHGDKDWRLSISTASALEAQARWNGSSEKGEPSWWLSALASWFSEAPPGRFQWPLEVARAVQPASGFRMAGDRLRILVAESLVARLHRDKIRSLRVQDVPAPIQLSGATPPTLLLSPGVDVPRGAPWLSVPGKMWGMPRAAHVTDAAHRRLKSIDAEAGDPNRVDLFLGPDEHGTVSFMELTPRRGPLGQIHGWRAAIQLCPSSAKWIGALKDGRAVEVEIRSRADMPYTPDGAELEICVLDPLYREQGMGTYVFSSEDGELLGEASAVDVLLGAVAPWAADCPPDVHLNYRALDGEGQPADGSAPQISDTWRNWLAAAKPLHARLCDNAERDANAGVPPTVSRLRELAGAVGPNAFRVGPREWLKPGIATLFEQGFDPTLRVTRRKQQPASLFEYTCVCGKVHGRRSTSLICQKCGTRVARKAAPLLAQVASREALPEALIHPWRKPAIAALCGLTLEELAKLLGEVPAAELCKELLTNDEPAGKATLVRLAGGACSQPVRLKLERNYLELQAGLSMAGSLKSFLDAALLHEVMEPLGLEALCGLPAGATVLQAPMILLRLRHVHAAAAAHGALLDVGSVSNFTRSALNETVDAFFGVDDSPHEGELESLRLWLRRLLPTTRRKPKHHTIPGLFRSNENLSHWASESRPFGTLPAVAEPLPHDEANEFKPAELCLVHRERVLTIPTPGRSVNAADPASWKKVYAYGKLLSEYQPQVAAIAIATESLSFEEHEWTAAGWPIEADRRLVGQVVLMHLWSELKTQRADPCALLSLLSREAPLELPSDADEAEELIGQILLRVLPSRTPLISFVRSTVARVLSGWSRTDAGNHNGVVARWSGVREHRATRFIPEAGSAAWRLLPGTAPLLAPERWFLDGPFENLSPIVHQLFRWGDYSVAPRWDEQLDVVSETVPIEEAIAEPTIELANEITIDAAPPPAVVPSQPPRSTTMISLFEDSLTSWMN